MTKNLYLARLVFFISLTLLIELFGLPQPITGPLVNMMLILTALVLDPLAGVILGTITPLVAGFRGQLPAILLPMVPAIIIANALFVLTFSTVQKSLKHVIPVMISTLLALLIAATIKFLLLYAAASWIIPILFGKSFPEAILTMMTFPQFLSAFIGGIFALGSYQTIKRLGIIR